MSTDSFTALFIYVLSLGVQFTCGSTVMIRALPHRVVKWGESVIIQCSTELNTNGLRLQRKDYPYCYKDGKSNEKVANFTQPCHHQDFSGGGSFLCQSRDGSDWQSSDDLTLKIIDPEKPTISAYQKMDDKQSETTIVCKAPDPPEECTISILILFYNDNPLKNCTPEHPSSRAIYKTSDRHLLDKITCSYVLKVKESPEYYIYSPRSENLQHAKQKYVGQENENTAFICEVDDATLRTHDPILIPVIASVCGVLALVLFVIILVFIIHKKKSSNQKMKNSKVLMEKADTTNEPQLLFETTYEATHCSAEETKSTANHNVKVPDTKVQEDGVTYAIINTSALKKKQHSSSNQQISSKEEAGFLQQDSSRIPPDISLYAEVKRLN